MLNTNSINKIKLARLISGYSQAELAKMLGVTCGSVSQWETGRTHPSVRKLKKLSTILGVSVEDILSIEEKAG